ncbi:TetR/AcrR family transcriptional regulator [Streptomyces angustmyceticus]|uniref:TetR family transcriptional regulator n=1 Tax=Streptomyces angustmyceticus TaxID=285578 RepID=A0A5J4LEQ5_9ACTN|nr:TetR/AcrR family transcriptional regulator [Streptomyces angustmyceticus]UAL69776.1 TetR/AcrR family transcriptional regulator [Streptomyces angustmyceticus]GES32643.1 TetR family transcriptional regulator [Streptomyces angustmyceticus]
MAEGVTDGARNGVDDGGTEGERRGGGTAADDGTDGPWKETGFTEDEGRLTLRERKKLRTRQRISGEATLLFIRRGFDHVTVAEVARAAEVSTMTVFNYFPRKEDLFLDRIPEAGERITRAVRERGADETPLAALRRLTLGLLAERHPLAGVGEGFEHFWRTVLDSPALRARAREAVEELEQTLAALLSEAAGGDPERPGRTDRLAAALIIAGIRAAFVEAVTRQLGGDPVAAVAVEQAEVLRRTFDALERALARDV